MDPKNTAGQAVTGLLTKAEERLWIDFQDSGAFNHSVLIGSGREQAVIQFLSNRLPGRFGVAHGQVVDLAGKYSGQIDIIVYDASQNAPLLTQDNGQILLPAEALLATVEVKSKLTKAETHNAIRGIDKIRKFRPWGEDWARSRPRSSPSDGGLPRYFASVLAYETDLGVNDWQIKELTRIRAQCSELGTHSEYVDRVAVLSRGLLLPGEGRAATHTEERKVLGIWYFSLLNFLTREVNRRKAFPWADYESWNGRKWDQVLPEDYSAPEPNSYSKTQIKKYKAIPKG